MDTVAQDIVKVTFSTSKEPSIFHLVPKDRFPLSTFFSALQKAGYSISCLDYKTWRKQLLSDMTEQNALFPISPLFSEDYLEQLPNPIYECDHSMKMELGSPESNISNHLTTYFQYLINANFLPENVKMKKTESTIPLFSRSHAK